MKIAVHGLGYVGLTAAVAYALSGARVVGYDPSSRLVSQLKTGNIPHGSALQASLAEDLLRVQTSMSAGHLVLTDDYTPVVTSDVHVIAVPTERHGEPWMDLLIAVVERIVDTVDTAKLTILIESTMTPGTMDELLKRIDGKGRTPGVDFFLAATPRRDWFADSEKNLHNLSRVVGGVTPQCLTRARDVVTRVSQKVYSAKSYREAELVKPAENALFYAMVMAGYEIANAYPNVDVNDVLALAGTHWRLPPLHLGLGTGGRCVPLGPKYLAAGTPRIMRIGKAASDTDLRFPFKIADGIAKACVDLQAVVILGVAYRPDFKDAGSSPVRTVAKWLSVQHIPFAVHDPMFETHELNDIIGRECAILPEYLPEYVHEARLVLLATAHSAYAALVSKFVWRPGQIVLDATGFWSPIRETIERAGARYIRVGDAGWYAALLGA